MLSASHLVSFIDLEYAGPQSLFFDTILRFPQAPSLDSQFGIAIHETLEWLQHHVNEHEYLPSITETLGQFTMHMRSKKLIAQRTEIEIERGHRALTIYLKMRGKMFHPTSIAEKNFRSENVILGNARLTGRIDCLEIDTAHRTITVVDYKTGKSYDHWTNDIKLHKHHYSSTLTNY